MNSYEPQHSATTSKRKRLLSLEGGCNFRDLGGYTTADGHRVCWSKIYRSGSLAALTEADYVYLNGRHIETIIDLRYIEEREEEPTDWRAGDPEILSWNHQELMDRESIMRLAGNPETAAARLDKIMADIYPDLLVHHQEQYKEMFARLAADDAPLLFHCTAGKDRTGIAAALVLSALGVDRKQIIADYELSNNYLRHDVEDVSSQIAHAESAIAPQISTFYRQVMGSARGSWIEGMFAKMEAESGSVLNYIQQHLDVSDSELAAIRANYLEPRDS